MTRLEKRENLFEQYLSDFCADRGYYLPYAGLVREEQRDREGKTLPEISQRLHEMVAGSRECAPYQIVFDVLYLRAALATWEPSDAPQWAAYDSAVKALVEAVLAEVKELPDLEKEAA